MGEFLRRLSRSLKESSQDWPQIAAQYEQGKEQEAFRRLGLERQTRRDEMYDAYRKHGQNLQKFQLQLAPLTHELELLGQQAQKAIELGDVDVLDEINRRQAEVQAQMKQMLQQALGDAEKTVPSMPSQAPQTAPTARPSSMPSYGQSEVLGESRVPSEPLTGMPSSLLDQSPLAPLRRSPEDSPVKNLPATVQLDDKGNIIPMPNAGDAVRNLPASVEVDANGNIIPAPNIKEAEQLLGSPAEDTSISMRLARGARSKKEKEELRKAITGARVAASKGGAQAGVDYLEMAVGRPLTEEEKSFYRPRLHEVAPVQNDTEGIYRYLIQEAPENRRSIWMGLPAKTRSALLAQHPDLKIPTVDSMSRRQGNQLGSVDYLVGKTFDYLGDTKFTDKMGPVWGNVYGLNPADQDVQAFKSHILLSAQIIGKYLEGGKMTDMDALRYMEMLPKFTNTPEVARRKMENIKGLVEATKKIYLSNSSYDPQGNNVLALPFNPNSAPLSDLAEWLNENGESDANASEILQIYENRRELESMTLEEEDAVMQEGQ